MDYIAPTLDEIEELARQTVADLPPPFRGEAEKVAIVVADFADDDVLKDLEMDAFDLTGLYDGIPLTEKSNWDVPRALTPSGSSAAPSSTNGPNAAMSPSPTLSPM